MPSKKAPIDEFDTVDTFNVADANVGEIIDLSEVPEEIEYELLPNGMYNAEITGAEFGTSQRSGNPMITWTFSMTAPNGESRNFWYHTVMTEKGLPRLKRMLVRLRPFANREFSFERFNPNDADEIFNGVRCQIRLGAQTYDGKRRNQVADVLPPAEGFATSGDEFSA